MGLDVEMPIVVAAPVRSAGRGLSQRDEVTCQ